MESLTVKMDLLLVQNRLFIDLYTDLDFHPGMEQQAHGNTGTRDSIRRLTMWYYHWAERRVTFSLVPEVKYIRYGIYAPITHEISIGARFSITVTTCFHNRI